MSLSRLGHTGVYESHPATHPNLSGPACLLGAPLVLDRSVRQVKGALSAAAALLEDAPEEAVRREGRGCPTSHSELHPDWNPSSFQPPENLSYWGWCFGYDL